MLRLYFTYEELKRDHWIICRVVYLTYKDLKRSPQSLSR